jgi:hypothetical protein
MGWEPNFEIPPCTPLDDAVTMMINRARDHDKDIRAEFNSHRLTATPYSTRHELISQWEASRDEERGLEAAAGIIRQHKLACFEDLLNACEIMVDCTKEEEDRIRLARYDQCSVFVSMAIKKAKGPPL